MNTIEKDGKLGMKAKLSTLWIFVMFNYLYADVIGLMDPVLLNQYITGTIAGIKMTEPILLVAAIEIEIPIAMVLLSAVLEYNANRWSNVIAGIIKTIVVFSSMFVGSGSTLYYMFFGTIEIACTSFIVWYAWNWKEEEASS